MDMEKVPLGVMHRGVNLDSISRDATIDDRWQVNKAFAISPTKGNFSMSVLIGFLANIGISAALVAGSVIAGVSPDQVEVILGVGFLAALPVSFPLGFAITRHGNSNYHYFISMNEMGIFDKKDRENFLKTMKSLPARKALFVETPPNHNGDIGIWKVTSNSLTFHGIKPGDGGWEDAFEQVISFYGLNTGENDAWDEDFEDYLFYEPMPYGKDYKEKDYLHSMAREYIEDHSELM